MKGWAERMKVVINRSHNHSIINLSLIHIYDALLEEAVNYAHDAGVLIIASSGNSSGSVQYPARFANVVAVGAVNANDSKSNYSSYGPEPVSYTHLDVYKRQV